MTTPAATIRRIRTLTITFARVGPVPPPRTRKVPTAPPLTLSVPPHTAKDVDAVVGYVTEHLRRHVRMFLPTDDRFTVSIDLDAAGSGTVLIDGGRSGRGTVRPVEQ